MKSSLLAAAAASVVFSLAVPATQAVAAPVVYAALGDSFSAGVGTSNKVNSCYQSPEGYPVLVARQKGWTLNYRACSGAVVADVVNSQLPAVASTTGRVTVTAGGNDAGFAPALTECAKPGWMSDCDGRLDQAASVITNVLPGRLDDLYGRIRARAPQARVSALGYPRLFNGTDCSIITFFSPAEQARMNALTDTLDGLIRQKALARGVDFIDPRAAFAGHAWCSSSEWVNGPSLPLEESYHPNDAGNAAYASLVTGTSRFSALGRPGAATTAAPESYARVLPELASEQNIARAERAGISAALIRRLDADLRSGDRQRGKAAVLKLQQLDAAASAGTR